MSNAAVPKPGSTKQRKVKFPTAPKRRVATIAERVRAVRRLAKLGLPVASVEQMSRESMPKV